MSEELYRPANGTEGMIFFEGWCAHCARDKPMSEGKDYDECDESEICEIIGATFRHDVDEPEYPKEWVYGEDGCPMCKAFIHAGHPVPLKDDLTIDLFGD